MSATHRWGSAAIDLAARDLPALKVSFLISHAPSRGKLLELGCGEGKILRTLLRERPALELLGCDVRDVSPSDRAFEFRRIATARSGWERIPAADGELDAVLFADVLEHTPDPAATLAELWRVLRPGGSLLGFVPLEGERWSAYALYRALLGQDLYLHTKDHVQSFTLAGARALLGRFQIVEERFAYHLLGQAMDASFFAAARLPRLARFWWTENRYYAPPPTPGESAALLPRALNHLLALGNRVAHAESSLLGRVPWLSAGLLFAARRP
ncbi:MAG TPA: class I SAM-dependent methyltransferase [Polyangiaceae bacterium]